MTPRNPALADILAQLMAVRPDAAPADALSGRTVAHVASTIYAKEGINTYIVQLIGMLAARHARLTQIVLYEFKESGLVDPVEIGSGRIVFISFKLDSPEHLLALLRQWHEGQSLDLIAVQVPFFPEARAAAEYAHRQDIGFVAYNHAGPDGLGEAEERLFRETLTLNPRARVLAVSEASRDKIVRESGLDIPVALVGQMLAVTRFTPVERPDEIVQAQALRRQMGAHDPDDILVLAPNSFIPRKMPLDLLRAADTLVNGRGAQRLKLAFVGHTTFAKSTEIFQQALRFVQERGLAGHVSFSEPVDHALLRLVYAAADIVVLPGRSETFGLVLAEAGLMRRPVIGYDRPGIREVVAHGETGLLAEWSDSDDIRVDRLAAALETLCRDAGRRAAMGHAGRRRMLAEYDPAHTLHRHETAYVEAMSGTA